MRVFVFAVAVFVATAFCIGLGSWYVQRLCDQLSGILERLAAVEMGDTAAFAAVYRAYEMLWDKSECWLHILDGHEGADAIEEAFTELGLRFLAGDDLGCTILQEKLSLQIDKLREGERLTLDDVF